MPKRVSMGVLPQLLLTYPHLAVAGSMFVAPRALALPHLHLSPLLVAYLFGYFPIAYFPVTLRHFRTVSVARMVDLSRMR